MSKGIWVWELKTDFQKYKNFYFYKQHMRVFISTNIIIIY